jgi:hypothetical protein
MPPVPGMLAGLVGAIEPSIWFCGGCNELPREFLAGAAVWAAGRVGPPQTGGGKFWIFNLLG